MNEDIKCSQFECPELSKWIKYQWVINIWYFCCFQGYALFGSVMCLFLTTVGYHHSHSFFYALLLVFGGLSALRLVCICDALPFKFGPAYWSSVFSLFLMLIICPYLIVFIYILSLRKMAKETIAHQLIRISWLK